MYKKFYIVCALFIFGCMLSGCTTKFGESHTRLYPVTDYMIRDKGVEATYTLEDNVEESRFFKSRRVYLHEGENTLIVISGDKNGKGFDRVKAYYLYLNEDTYNKKIEDIGGS